MWQTRTLAQFVAATAFTDGENPLIDQASRIGKPPGADEKADGPKSGPNPGSFERFMSSFGAPQRWAGR